MTAFHKASLAGLVLAMSVPLIAHHAFTSEYDAKKPLTLTGVITNVSWEAPHASIFMDVKNESGQTENWQLEAASPVYLQKHGMKASTFAKGETITVNAYQASNGSRLASARAVTMAGKKMQVCDPCDDHGPVT